MARCSEPPECHCSIDRFCFDCFALELDMKSVMRPTEANRMQDAVSRLCLQSSAPVFVRMMNSGRTTPFCRGMQAVCTLKDTRKPVRLESRGAQYPCQHKMEQVYLPSRSVHPKVFVSFHRHGRRPLRDVSATVSLLSLSVYSLARHTPVSPVPPAALSAVSECCRRCSSPEFIASGCFRQNSRKDSSCVQRLGCRLHDLLRVDPRCALHSTDT
jgi:hypothetical protein